MASNFFNFLIVLVGLLIIVAMIFLALDKVAKDEFMKRMGKYAVGGAAVLILLYQLKAVFFGGSGGGIPPSALIEFAIGVIILVAIFVLVDMALAYFQAPYLDLINYVLTVLMLVILLVLAEQALFGGGLGLISKTGAFQLQLR